MFVRRATAVISSIALAAGATVLSAIPAQAAASSPSISPSQWAAGTSEAATLAWTEGTSVSSLMVRAPWPWTAAWTGASGAPAVASATVSGNAVTCGFAGGSSATFTVVGTVTAPVKCSSVNNPTNTGARPWFTGFWIEADTGGTLTVTAGSTVTVALTNGAVTAPASAQTDTWIVGNYSAANTNLGAAGVVEVASTSYITPTTASGGLAEQVTITLDANGGQCATASVSGARGTWQPLPATSTCRRDGYVFTGWQARQTWGGPAAATFTPDSYLHLTGDNTLYAMWTSAPTAPATPASSPSAPARSWSVKVTSYKRAKQLLGLRQSVTVGGRVTGLPAGTAVTVQWQLSTTRSAPSVNAAWHRAGETKTDKSGTFIFNRTLPAANTNGAVAVRVKVADPVTQAPGFSNRVVIQPAK